jgi:hypothetical protein
MANGYSVNWKNLEVNTDGIGTPVHPLVGLLLAAAMGGLFVVFLPFIGLYLFIKQMAVLASRGFRSLLHASVAPVAAPGVAFMTGAPSKSEPDERALEELANEIKEKRAE